MSVFVSNGLGPEWFPPMARAMLTLKATKHFPNRPWEDHDLAYYRGGSLWRKTKADFIFLKDLLVGSTSLKAVGISFILFGFTVTFGIFSFWFSK